MAAALQPMFHESRGSQAGHAISAPRTASRAGAAQYVQQTQYPASSKQSNGMSNNNTASLGLNEIASAALADAGESDSSQDSGRKGKVDMQSLPDSSNGSVGGSQTDDTSPKSALSQSQSLARKQDGVDDGVVRRPYTPEQTAENARLHESPPLKQGAKRTASGAVKATSNGFPAADARQDYAPRGHVRAKSSSRAVEIASALKARLAYAAVKVNNGWETQSLEQLEQISRMTSPSVTSPSTTSPQRRRFSMNSDYNDRYITSPDVRQSPHQFSNRPMHQRPYVQYPPPVMDNHVPAFTHTNGVPTLAPAAPIAPGRSHRRSLSTKAPPHLNTAHGYGYSGMDQHNTAYNSQPTTPRRQGILRMPSQQAEKDALDSLLFMASPNNSSNLKYTDSPAGPSPLRTEFPAAVKRVVFES